MNMKHLVLLIAAPALIACSGGSNDFVPPPTGVVVIPPPPPPPPPPPTPPATGDLIDGFGAGFATSFRADGQSEPSDPVAGDVIAIDKTTDPVDIPNP